MGWDRNSNREFDQFASSYHQALDRGLRLSGESSDYFAHWRVIILKQQLDRAGKRIRSILDFGCGTGTTIPILQEIFSTDTVVGVDISEQSLEIARKNLPGAKLFNTSALPPGFRVDLVYTNGVFHHMSSQEQGLAFQYMSDRLKAGGYVALWENNPFSPAARLVMSRIPFDKAARMVWPKQARALAEGAGLSVVSTRYEFIFPRMFSSLRFLENRLHAFPLGAQYMILSRKQPRD